MLLVRGLRMTTRKMPSVRTLVVEDFATFRRYVCSVLQQQPELTIVGEAGDGLTAVSLANSLRPELILLDVGLPELNGIEAARQIRQLVPDCNILILSQEMAPEIVEEALALGVRGYVTKTHVQRDLLAAVRAVLEGNVFVSPELRIAVSDIKD